VKPDEPPARVVGADGKSYPGENNEMASRNHKRNAEEGDPQGPEKTKALSDREIMEELTRRDPERYPPSILEEIDRLEAEAAPEDVEKP
jgi:hypothetical protein